MTLLHQHQRTKKTATVGGTTVAYVETTIGDIEVAHRLAHHVLGQSLDDLAPQTRRLLTAVHGYVTAEAKRLAVPTDLVRFTRRQLREHLAGAGAGWGDTQLKVHLARLVDLELLVVHRLTSGAFGYELTWTPPVDTAGGRFLVGLTDPATLHNPAPEPAGPAGGASAYDTPPVGPGPASSTYDPEPVGVPGAVVGPWSGVGRGLVGGRSHPTQAARDGREASASEGDDVGDEGGDPFGDVLRVAAGGRG